MSTSGPASDGPCAALARLVAGTNAHDLEAIARCFAEGYCNETPAHPARGFTGKEQVRRNWARILAKVPDIVAEVVDSAESGDWIWSEWEMRGTRRDGKAHLMRGVVVFGVAGELIVSARFYLEPVDASGIDVDAAVRRAVGGTS